VQRVGDAEAGGVPHPGDTALPRGAEEGRAGPREAAHPAQERLLPAAGPRGALRARAAPPGLLMRMNYAVCGGLCSGVVILRVVDTSSVSSPLYSRV
jgi:hypothetical protein